MGDNEKTETVERSMRRSQSVNLKRAAADNSAVMNDIKLRSDTARHFKFIIKFLQNHKGIFSAKQWRQSVAGFKIVNNSVKMIWVRMGQKNSLGVQERGLQELSDIGNRRYRVPNPQSLVIIKFSKVNNDGGSFKARFEFFNVGILITMPADLVYVITAERPPKQSAL